MSANVAMKNIIYNMNKFLVRFGDYILNVSKSENTPVQKQLLIYSYFASMCGLLQDDFANLFMDEQKTTLKKKIQEWKDSCLRMPGLSEKNIDEIGIASQNVNNIIDTPLTPKNDYRLKYKLDDNQFKVLKEQAQVLYQQMYTIISFYIENMKKGVYGSTFYISGKQTPFLSTIFSRLWKRKSIDKPMNHLQQWQSFVNSLATITVGMALNSNDWDAATLYFEQLQIILQELARHHISYSMAKDVSRLGEMVRHNDTQVAVPLVFNGRLIQTNPSPMETYLKRLDDAVKPSLLGYRNHHVEMIREAHQMKEEKNKPLMDFIFSLQNTPVTSETLRQYYDEIRKEMKGYKMTKRILEKYLKAQPNERKLPPKQQERGQQQYGLDRLFLERVVPPPKPPRPVPTVKPPQEKPVPPPKPPRPVPTVKPPQKWVMLSEKLDQLDKGFDQINQNTMQAMSDQLDKVSQDDDLYNFLIGFDPNKSKEEYEKRKEQLEKYNLINRILQNNIRKTTRPPKPPRPVPSVKPPQAWKMLSEKLNQLDEGFDQINENTMQAITDQLDKVAQDKDLYNFLIGFDRQKSKEEYENKKDALEEKYPLINIILKNNMKKQSAPTVEKEQQKKRLFEKIYIDNLREEIKQIIDQKFQEFGITQDNLEEISLNNPSLLKNVLIDIFGKEYLKLAQSITLYHPSNLSEFKKQLNDIRMKLYLNSKAQSQDVVDDIIKEMEEQAKRRQEQQAEKRAIKQAQIEKWGDEQKARKDAQAEKRARDAAQAKRKADEQAEKNRQAQNERMAAEKKAREQAQAEDLQKARIKAEEEQKAKVAAQEAKRKADEQEAEKRARDAAQAKRKAAEQAEKNRQAQNERMAQEEQLSRVAAADEQAKKKADEEQKAKVAAQEAKRRAENKRVLEEAAKQATRREKEKEQKAKVAAQEAKRRAENKRVLEEAAKQATRREKEKEQKAKVAAQEAKRRADEQEQKKKNMEKVKTEARNDAKKIVEQQLNINKSIVQQKPENETTRRSYNNAIKNALIGILGQENAQRADYLSKNRPHDFNEFKNLIIEEKSKLLLLPKKPAKKPSRLQPIAGPREIGSQFQQALTSPKKEEDKKRRREQTQGQETETKKLKKQTKVPKKKKQTEQQRARRKLTQQQFQVWKRTRNAKKSEAEMAIQLEKQRKKRQIERIAAARRDAEDRARREAAAQGKPTVVEVKPGKVIQTKEQQKEEQAPVIGRPFAYYPGSGRLMGNAPLRPTLQALNRR